jgi:hypothetical protein
MRTIHPPSGLTGLAVEPWSPGEIYAVAADWRRADAPILIYEDGWHSLGIQVGDMGHSAHRALEHVMRHVLLLDADKVAPADLDAILGDAVTL